MTIFRLRRVPFYLSSTSGKSKERYIREIIFGKRCLIRSSPERDWGRTPQSWFSSRNDYFLLKSVPFILNLLSKSTFAEEFGWFFEGINLGFFGDRATDIGRGLEHAQ